MLILSKIELHMFVLIVIVIIPLLQHPFGIAFCSLLDPPAFVTAFLGVTDIGSRTDTCWCRRVECVCRRSDWPSPGVATDPRQAWRPTLARRGDRPSPGEATVDLEHTL